MNRRGVTDRQCLLFILCSLIISILLWVSMGGWSGIGRQLGVPNGLSPVDAKQDRRLTALESKPWTIHADKCMTFKEDDVTRVERLAKAHILGEADAAKYPRVTLVYDLWPDGRVDYNCINWANAKDRKGGGK